MATLAKRPRHEASTAYARVREVLSQEVGVDLTESEVNHFIVLVREKNTLDELSGAMARIQDPLPPATARAAQATENAVKSIEDEFGLLTSTEVAQLLGSGSGKASVRSLANDMRARGELLHLRRLNRYLYPDFQFDTSLGRVKPGVKDLLQLAEANSWEPEDVVLWLCSPTTYFEDGSRPVDHLDAEPELVIDVARRAWSVDW
ncbi:hypothetical protein [Arthrobacter sp.]|uniref:hypothetical protein n=1 Tax=Arthrobacter sp. TaxID=1667 RepID=UPI003A8D3841